MGKGRLEAFSDGVLAIIITIMVLELNIPHGFDLAALVPMLPVLASYVLSFIYVGIYWNNHHHLLALAKRLTGGQMWANMHLLFWLSLVPFTTAWAGESHMETGPAVAYGVVMLMAGLAYKLLQHLIVSDSPDRADLERVLGRDLKGMVSLVLYAGALAAAFVAPLVAYGLYAAVALMWVVPDKRVERIFEFLNR